MICVSGLEQDNAALAERLHRYHGMLQEVRLDALQTIDEDTFSLLRCHQPLILTCRNELEGGRYTGDQGDFWKLILRALETFPTYLDVEISQPLDLRKRIFQRCGETSLIASLHRFQPSSSLEEGFHMLSRQPGHLLKYAVQIEDASELLPLLHASKPDDRPFIRIGMGSTGVLSRGLYKTFQSPWTYAAANSDTASAPGQLTANQALTWRLGEMQSPRLFGLIGGDQVMRSPGISVYNRLFRQMHMDALYLPIVARELHKTMPLLEELGFEGISVTMPLKQEAVTYSFIQTEEAKHARAGNTLVRQDGGWHCDNTDMAAFRTLLHGMSDDVLILGAGGVARAVLAVVGSRGVVAARSLPRAQNLAGIFGARAIPWEQRNGMDCRTIVNATPVGSDGIDNPLPDDFPFQGRTVVDAVMGDGETPLVRRARRKGATVVDGYQMWLAQGAEQMSRFLEKQITPRHLGSFLDPPMVENKDG